MLFAVVIRKIKKREREKEKKKEGKKGRELDQRFKM